MTPEKPFLQFVPVSSFVQPSFWNKLAELKLNIDKLSENERDICGFFPNTSSTWSTHILEVDSTSFNSTFNPQNSYIPFHGKLFNKNTIEQFKDCDKSELISCQGRQFLDGLKSGAVLEKPSMLNFFLILSFSDLKKFHFYYWFAFPVPQDLQISLDSVSPISQFLSKTQLNNFVEEYLQLDLHQRAYFLFHDNKICTLKSTLLDINAGNCQQYYFVFADFINEGKLPKSQLKNYIIFLLHHCPSLGGQNINFISLFLDKKLTISQSLVYNLTLPQDCCLEKITWVGWEKNEKGKFAPRFSNMKATMDPKVLFEESVDLNLKLMKWRLLPDIDLDKIKNLKCLLLGSGTLGCSVARNLLGWGVRNITFVDNSTVSYSNPVRQHLFFYEDAIKNKPKAEAAAENLAKIFPSINARGHQLTIPMPGHTIGDSTLESVIETVDTLKELIQNHDVVFLLTDSRESRWLPTLLSVFYNKTIINVALGFDSYLIMRYGRIDGASVATAPAPSGFHKIAGSDLGCYFCNDVTAPGNSLKDRSLDQQCTVTRPGVSSIAGALAVELAVSLTQHEEGVGAPAFYRTGPQSDLTFDEEEGGLLGILPHSIRGFLSSFTHVLPATPRYDKCIACSEIVLGEFMARGFEFLRQSFNSCKYLEDLTGLNLLQHESNFIDVLEMSDEDISES